MSPRGLRRATRAWNFETEVQLSRQTLDFCNRSSAQQADTKYSSAGRISAQQADTLETEVQLSRREQSSMCAEKKCVNFRSSELLYSSAHIELCSIQLCCTSVQLSTHRALLPRAVCTAREQSSMCAVQLSTHRALPPRAQQADATGLLCAG